MSWFWFWVAVAFLVWNVFLMRALSIAQHDVRRLRRRESLRRAAASAAASKINRLMSGGQ